MSQTNSAEVDARDIPRFGNIPTFLGRPVAGDWSGVDIGLIGVPSDIGAGNRPGSRHGPRAVRDLSTLIKPVHQVSKTSPYALCEVADLGDSPVCNNDMQEYLARQESFYKAVKNARILPISVGGGHLLSLPVLRAIVEPPETVGMIHFDAHSDTADTYDGGIKYRNGTPFRRAIEEGLIDPKRCVQIGLRGPLYDGRQLDYPRDAGMRLIPIEEFNELGVEGTLREARKVVGDNPTYVTFDIDVVDPSFAPGTGTPEIGGMTSFQAQQMIRGLEGLNIIGADVVEVAPPYDHAGITAHLAANILFELLCVIAPVVAAQKRGQ